MSTAEKSLKILKDVYRLQENEPEVFGNRCEASFADKLQAANALGLAAGTLETWAETNVAPVGRGSVRLALVAGAAVRFCTLIEYVTVSMLTVTGSGESVKLLIRMSTCASAAGANAAMASTSHKRPKTATFISHPVKNRRR